MGRRGTTGASGSDGLIIAAINSLDVAIVVQSAEGVVLAHNPALAGLLGLDPDRIVGLGPNELLSDVTHDDGRPFDREQLPGRMALRTGAPRRNVTMRATRKDGEVRVLQVSAYPTEIDGMPVTVSQLVDITKKSLVPSDWRDSEDRFRLLADAAPIGIFVASPDGTSLYGNRQAEINTGRSWDEIKSLKWHEFIHPDDLAATAAEQQRAIDEDDEFVAEYRLVRPDGTMPWVRSRGGQIFDADGTLIGVIGTITDVTEIHEAHERMRESEERLRMVIDSAAEGIVSTDAAGTITTFNAAAERIFGYDSADAVGRLSFLDLLGSPTREQMERYWIDYLGGAPAVVVGQAPREVVGVNKEGAEIPIEIVVTELDTKEGRIFTSVIRDLSVHKALTDELEHRSTHDELTGLPNRSLLDAQLEVTLARAQRQESSVAVLAVFIDRLSMVAQSLGHRAADELLTEVANRLREVTDPTSLRARHSHDQFVVVIDDLADVGDAVDTAQRIIEAINRPFMLDGEEAFANAYVGIGVGQGGTATPSSLVADAGVAMRRAVESSITRFEIFDPLMRAQVDAHRRSEIALRHGMDREEFELFYQPVVDLQTHAAVGAEALIRWHRPGEGIVLPDRFIPIAEDSGLIVQLGAWVIEAACAQLARWHLEMGDAAPPISINLSGRQLAHPGLIDTVAGALSSTGADPTNVAFEITESVLLRDVEHAVATLEALRDLGVTISLDDFGTGYSSLTYLCRFPIDVVKIDRSFVSHDGWMNEPVVTMILGLAHTLGLDVVAEGVETEEQAERLRQLGCPKAQGYLFARPAPAGEWKRE